jgi:hypothetical protein
MLSNELNTKILQAVKGLRYDVSDIAPSTYEAILSTKTSRLVVWSGGSDKTIYGAASVNHAFRAWHDSLHIQLGAEFTLDGEIRVAREQARLIGSDKLGDILIAEVKGQAEYFAKHGEFPVDQVKFIVDYLKQAA